MRADRLLRLILVLSDGRARSARALADELEVSVRTLFRDLEALEIAGIPVRTTRGRYGGISLPREWTRYASGLSESEVVPLAALSLPAAYGQRTARTDLSAEHRESSDPSLQGALGSALSKIVAALPSVLKARAEHARQRLLIDPSPWWAPAEPPAALDCLRQAVWSDRCVQLRYRDARGQVTERRVEPLALALKAERWHLVADTERGLRVFRGDRIEQATLLLEGFTRRPDFDLPSFWQEHCRQFVRTRPTYRVRLELTALGREKLAAMRPPSERQEILEARHPEVDFQTQEIALGQLVALAGEGRALSPTDLIERLRALARHWLKQPLPESAPVENPANNPWTSGGTDLGSPEESSASLSNRRARSPSSP